MYMGFACSSVGKESPCSVGDQPLDWQDALEKEMRAHSSILAWKVSWMEEPDRLLSMGLQRVGHDSATNTYLLIHITRESLIIIYICVCAC